MSLALTCNFKNCCKEILNIGWTTRCSHIFCAEHGSILKRNWKTIKCPACGKEFKGNVDINEIRVDLSNEHKAMLLLGLPPDAVLEIASHAIKFWTYQRTQKLVILTKTRDYYRDKLAQTKDIIERNRQNSEMKLNDLKQQLEEANIKISQMNFELLEKNRIISSLQRKQHQVVGESSSPSTSNFNDFLTF